jgi:trehalose 6-phosphate phosphatase
MELPSDAPRQRPPALADDWALFLDVDGCLLDFAATPEAVVVPAGLTDTIAALAERLHGAVALVSGRALSMLDKLFPALRQMPAAGLHGLELRRPGAVAKAAPSAPAALQRVRIEAEAIGQEWPGTWVEAKGPNLALHWRSAPAAVHAFHAFASAALPRLPGYRLQGGDHVLEFRPDNHLDKGEAIRVLMEEPPFRGRLPVFVGDDRTDEHGFDVVNARDGYSVLVGVRDDSAARYALPDPASVRAWLRAMAAEKAEQA